MSRELEWGEFFEALRHAVAPRRGPGGGEGAPDRKAKARTVLPPFQLRTDDREPMIGKLAAFLHAESDRRVPHVRIAVAANAPGPDVRIRPLCADLAPDDPRRGVPRLTGRLRLPNYALLHTTVEWASDPAATATLRDFCYERHRGPVRSALWTLGGGDAPTDGAGLATAWYWLSRPVCQYLPRWLWARRHTRRLLRSKKHGWYARLVAGRSPLFGEEFFHHVGDRVAALLDPDSPRPGAEREPELERLLLHALMADLNRWARPGRLSPWRRRRVTRFVVLLPVPDADEARARCQRFLCEFGAAARATGCGAALLLAVGPSGPDPAAGVETGPVEAARTLRRGPEANDDVAPRLLALPPGLAGLPEPHPVEVPVRSGHDPAVEAVFYGLTVAMAAATVPFLPLWDDEPTTCLGNAPTGEITSSPPAARADDLPALADQASELIERENERVERARADGATVRTVAYVARPVSEGPAEELQPSDGAVPELRGLALAQADLNAEARGDDVKILLRVEMFDAGPRYAEAVDVANRIVRLAEEDPDELIGVVGIAQSWDVTQEAVRILNAAEIPTISTNATADEMQPGTFYHQMGPPSSREADIAAEFTREASIVQDENGQCAPAEAAIVIQDPADLYSTSLGNSFMTEFEARGGSWHTLWYTPPDLATGTPTQPADPRIRRENNMHAVAESVCARILQEPDTETVVYWAARSREFGAFLNDFEDSTDCAGDRLTAVGGNGLTNAALSGLFGDRSWLRLYHAAHVLPVGRSASHIAEGFNAHYAATFGADDPWRNDGHAALVYDAMQVLAEAANETYAASGGRSVGREGVQATLYGGIVKAGASGAIDFPPGEPVSRNKPVVILHHTAAGSEPVLACGAFAHNAEPVDTWGPDGAFDCPQDD
ncbi:hypothetical protein [Streptomyces litchfieldiae]|uniref:ABC transporter substrate-binding protein n=1 Tax=Streptomyces litchfieldiae TaxID=3075543 RepID=A0ABU2MUM0_9ACTN|nr:hypothetical protein [Streptomyces sp. DSM 44938]MDT0345102.1 hypothetical protein [Streptomyces sp. DSM 44938]